MNDIATAGLYVGFGVQLFIAGIAWGDSRARLNNVESRQKEDREAQQKVVIAANAPIEQRVVKLENDFRDVKGAFETALRSAVSEIKADIEKFGDRLGKTIDELELRVRTVEHGKVSRADLPAVSGGGGAPRPRMREDG